MIITDRRYARGAGLSRLKYEWLRAHWQLVNAVAEVVEAKAG